MTAEFKVGSRVKYIGPKLLNDSEGVDKPDEDVVVGHLGTVIAVGDVVNGVFPIAVIFDNHREGVEWPMDIKELELLE